MADEDWCDPCGCVWNRELSMRRLLSLLRQSQSYCTENVCYEDPMPNIDQSSSSVLFMGFVFAIAVFMLYMRPNLNWAESTKKAGGKGSDGPPPPPPPATI